jgi:hypothetical protein
MPADDRNVDGPRHRDHAAINPMSVIYGLGHATMEELVYDACQPVTGTLMDHALPRADGLPAGEIVRHDVPAPSNPLNVKGAGEAGTSGVGAALASAVASAVGPAAARHLPITASRVPAAPDKEEAPSTLAGLRRSALTTHTAPLAAMRLV